MRQPHWRPDHAAWRRRAHLAGAVGLGAGALHRKKISGEGRPNIICGSGEGGEMRRPQSHLGSDPSQRCNTGVLRTPASSSCRDSQMTSSTALIPRPIRAEMHKGENPNIANACRGRIEEYGCRRGWRRSPGRAPHREGGGARGRRMEALRVGIGAAARSLFPSSLRRRADEGAPSRGRSEKEVAFTLSELFKKESGRKTSVSRP